MVKRNAGSLARRRSLYAPSHVRLFGPHRIMIYPQHIADVIEQLARLRRRPAKLLFFPQERVYFGRTNPRKMPTPLLHLQPILEATSGNRQKKFCLLRCYTGATTVDIEVFTICDAATISCGKLNILGSFDRLYYQEVPISASRLCGSYQSAL